MAEDLSDVNVTLVDTSEKVLDFLTWLGRSRRVLAVDTETTGLLWYRDRLRLVQVGDRDHAYCFAADDWMGLLKDVIGRYDGEFVFHNAKFDIHFLERRGLVWTPDMWRRTHDTAVLAHLHQPDHSRALKTLTRAYIDPRAAMASNMLDEAMHVQGWDWATVPIDFPYYWFYGGLDTILTARLFDALPRDRITAELEDVERKVLWSTYKMEQRGAFVDLMHCAATKLACEGYAEQVKRYLATEYGLVREAGAKFPSNTQIIAKFKELGVELTKLTKSEKAYALDEDVLESIDHPLAALVLDVRKKMKIAGTYMDNFLEMNEDGLIRCDINTLGTRTGRMTIARPALQTLTRGKGPVRDAFVSRYGEIEGRMIMVDYDQIEMRQYAVLSQDATLCEAFGGGDFFTTLTRQIFNDPTIGKNDVRRQHTKNARYAKNYGASNRKIALTNGISVDEVDVIEAGWDAAYPKAAHFPKVIEALAHQRMQDEGAAYVTTPTLKRYEPSKGREYYQLVNYLIQGFAADVFKEAVVRCDEAGLDEFMVLPIHDEAVFDVPLELAEDVAQTAQRVMRDDRYAVPFTTGCDVVARWGDKYL